MSEAQVGTIHDLLAECIACAGVFDVSTDYEADKADLENATQAVLDHVQTLRDQRDRLRRALEAFCDEVEMDAAVMAYKCDLGAGEWEAFIDRTKLYKQYLAGKAALTPAGQRWTRSLTKSVVKDSLTTELIPLTPNEATE